MRVYQPFLQVRNDCLVHYNLPVVRPPTVTKNLSIKSYSGKVTGAASKRMKKAIDILLQITPVRTTWNPVTKKYFPFQLNFVTLTVSAHRNISAKEGYYSLMKPYLRKMRKHGNFSYIWKAELQKRGQLHYHLATNTFLPWQSIRTTWNNLQRKARLLDDFALKHGHFDANSTDVHAISSVKNVAAYLAEYMVKKGNVSINGKTWDCSTNLKRQRFSFTPTAKQDDMLRDFQRLAPQNVIELDHCTIFKVPRPLAFLTANNIKDYVIWKS